MLARAQPNPTTPDSRPCWCGGNCPNVKRALELEAEKKPRLAEIELHNRLIDAPDCQQAHSLMARILAGENRAVFAAEHVKRAIAVAGPLPALVAQHATILRQAVKLKEAIAAARLATEQEPENPDAWAMLIKCLHENDELDEAAELVLDCDWRFANTHHKGISIRRVSALIDADRGDLEKALKRLSAANLVPLELFDRGRIKEKLKDYAGAWSDWMRGKEIMRNDGCHYDMTWHENFNSYMVAFVRSRRFSQLKPCEPSIVAPWPIFITGFPRSGTTMIEAVLSSHKHVAAGDELPFLAETIQHLPGFLRVRDEYPRALAAAAQPENEMMLSIARDFYIRKSVAKIGNVNGCGFFTDKMPSNEKHWPLMMLLWPRSPILHLRRHPLDILLSNMSHYLTHGGFVACALEWCAHQMALTDELMAFYRDRLDGLNMMEVRYEDFVTDHRAGVDRILDFCTLDREPACYDFHLSAWKSRTISHRQIKAPANAGSVGRWEPFRDFLKPIFLQIDPILQRHGYSL